MSVVAPLPPPPISTPPSPRDTQCPVCTAGLESHGESIRAWGEPTDHPILFGDILSLECGHRLHRACMVGWINNAPAASCPMCRKVTTWAPSATEQTNLRALVTQSWKTLHESEQNWILWTWVIAGGVALTDPIGFYVIAGLLMMLTPPMMYADMAMLLAGVRRFVVAKSAPGMRIMLATTVALAVTLVVLTLHVADDL